MQLDEEAEKRYCPKCDKVETKSECSYGPKYWEENAKKVDTQEESYTIDPKAHRKNQRAAKIRTLSKKGATEGERSAEKEKPKVLRCLVKVLPGLRKRVRTLQVD